jgi:hypothetical protein
MALDLDIDHSEVTELVVTFERASQRLDRNLDSVFDDEADALTREMKRDAAGHRFLPKLPQALSKEKLGPRDYLIGFNTGSRRHQGSLAHIIVFGSVNNAPVYNFYGPITRRAVPFVEHVARIAEDSIFTTKGR